MNRFQEEMETKRRSFQDKIHAAFVLKTSISQIKPLTEPERFWLKAMYPGSVIDKQYYEKGHYYIITPKF